MLLITIIMLLIKINLIQLMMHYSRLFWSSIIKFIPSLKIFRMLMKLGKKNPYESMRVSKNPKRCFREEKIENIFSEFAQSPSFSGKLH